MKSVNQKQQDVLIGQIITKAMCVTDSDAPSKPFVFDSGRKKHPLCDVILPGIDPV